MTGARKLTRYMMLEIAAQLDALAESDRDSDHVDPQLLNLLRSWVLHRYPGYTHLRERAQELQKIADEIPFGIPSARESKAEIKAWAAYRAGEAKRPKPRTEKITQRPTKPSTPSTRRRPSA